MTMKLSAKLTTMLFLWTALLLVRPPMASAVPAKLADDTYTTTGNGTNFGTTGVINVATSTSRKGWIKFDLSTLPAGTTGASVSKATVSLFANAVGAAGTINVNRILTPWIETAIHGNSEPTIGAADATLSV